MNESKVKLSVRLPELERRRFHQLALQRGLNMEEALLQAIHGWIATAKPGELPPAAPQPRALQERPAARGPRAKRERETHAPAAPESYPSANPGGSRHAPAGSDRALVHAVRPRRASASQRAPSLSKTTAKDPLVPMAEDIAAASRMDTASALDLLQRAEKMGATLEAQDMAGAAAVSPALAGGNQPEPQDDVATWPQRALALDWSLCPAVESIKTKRGPVWVFRGTRRPLWDLFHNLHRGHSVEALIKHFPDMNGEQVAAVIQFAGERIFIPDL